MRPPSNNGKVPTSAGLHKVAAFGLIVGNTADLAHVSEKTGTHRRLEVLLIGLRKLLERTSQAISEAYFTHTQVSRRLVDTDSEVIR